jgi:hypothetical protein
MMKPKPNAQRTAAVHGGQGRQKGKGKSAGAEMGETGRRGEGETTAVRPATALSDVHPFAVRESTCPCL